MQQTLRRYFFILLFKIHLSLCSECVLFLSLSLSRFKSQVLSELPSPITSGTAVTVEDLKQELTCNINIKHRFFFALYIRLSIAFLICEVFKIL